MEVTALNPYIAFLVGCLGIILHLLKKRMEITFSYKGFLSWIKKRLLSITVSVLSWLLFMLMWQNGMFAILGMAPPLTYMAVVWGYGAETVLGQYIQSKIENSKSNM